MTNPRKPSTRSVPCGELGLLHGGDYNPDQWLHEPAVIEEDFRLMHESGCNTFSIGVFAWTKLEPEPGVFDFDWLDRIMDRLEAEGFRAALATPSGALPFWLTQKHPECLRVNWDGHRERPMNRHNFCRSAPALREHVRRMNTELARRYAHHPALGFWHVSNEMQGECFCETCLAEFRAWLREQYGDLDTLNRAYWADFWSHRFTDWAQINPWDFVLDGLSIDWKRFTSESIARHIEFEAAPLREANSEIAVTTNFMGPNPNMDYRRIARSVDFVSDDQYPQFDIDAPDFRRRLAQTAFNHDLMRCLKGDSRPWLLLESCVEGKALWSGKGKLKRPGIHHLQMLQALAHGADGTMVFQWRKGQGGCEKDHGAIVGHSHCGETRIFKEVAALGDRYGKLAEIRGSTLSAKVALVFDWEAWWGYSTALGNWKSREPKAWLGVVIDHYEAFWRRNIAVDIIGPDDDFSQYRLLLCPMLYTVKEGFSQRLAQHVKEGGHALFSAYSGFCNPQGLWYRDGCPGDGLEELFGVWLEEIDQPGDNCGVPLSFDDDSKGEARDFIGHLHAKSAEVVAVHRGGMFENDPVFTCNTVGDGKAWFMASRLEPATLDTAYDRIIKECALLPARPGLPAGVSAVVRENQGKEYLFLLNTTDQPLTCTLQSAHEDVETCEATTKAILAPFAVRIFRI